MWPKNPLSRSPKKAIRVIRRLFISANAPQMDEKRLIVSRIHLGRIVIQAFFEWSFPLIGCPFRKRKR